MAKRFFKAEANGRIYFRATDTRDYRSLVNVAPPAKRNVYFVPGFSAKAPGPGSFSTEAISKDEYASLVVAKNARLVAEGKDPSRDNAPDNSWIAASAT